MVLGINQDAFLCAPIASGRHGRPRGASQGGGVSATEHVIAQSDVSTMMHWSFSSGRIRSTRGERYGYRRDPGIANAAKRRHGNPLTRLSPNSGDSQDGRHPSCNSARHSLLILGVGKKRQLFRIAQEFGLHEYSGHLR